MDLTGTQFLVAAGQFALVVLVTFIVVSLVTSYLRFEQAALKAKEEAPAKSASTGFPVLLADRFARERPEGKWPTLLLVSPNEYFSLKVDGKESLAAEMARFTEGRIRRLVRGGDIVALCDPGLIGVIMDAPGHALEALALRVQSAMTEEPMPVAEGVDLDISVRVSVVGRRDARISAQALIDVAKANLEAGLVAEASPSSAGATHHDGGASVGRTDILDALTGVLKREHLDATLQKYVALFRRDDRPIALLHAGVDYLKRYNEQYGRDTGDRIIKHFGDFLQRATREEDLIGRAEGDEFIIALSSTADDALGVARRLLGQLKKAEPLAAGTALRYSVSIGVAGCPEHGGVVRELLDAASAAMRAVKARGRNNAAFPDTVVKKRDEKKADAPRDVF